MKEKPAMVDMMEKYINMVYGNDDEKKWNNFIEVNVVFKQSKKLRFVRFKNIFTF